MHMRKLIYSSLSPGFVDSFVAGEQCSPSADTYATQTNQTTTTNYDSLWKKLFGFLQSHRVAVSMINEPYVASRLAVIELRRNVLHELERNLLDEMTSKA